MSIEIAFQELLECGRAEGVELIAAIPSDQINQLLSEDRSALQAWQSQGYAGDMKFMLRDPALFGGTEHILAGAKSVAIFAASYAAPASLEASQKVAPPGFGRIARYAWGGDYHTVLRARLKRALHRVIAKKNLSASDLHARVFSDSVPLLERALAREGRLGFVGRNSLFIKPGMGSFIFLSEIVSNLEIQDAPEPERWSESQPGAGCGECKRCAPACPTNAIVSDGVIDSRKCIAYLTIEKRGEFSEEESRALGDWVFGCDICQEVCPFNHTNIQGAVIDEFQLRQGQGPFLALEEILQIADATAYKTRFGASAIMRAGWESLARNACAVVANTAHLPALETLTGVFKSSSSEVIKASAGQALRRLGTEQGSSVREKIEKLCGRELWN